MKATQVLFLLRMKLINSQLIESWGERNKPFSAYAEVRNAIFWQRIALFTFTVGIGVLFSGFFLGEWLTRIGGAVVIVGMGFVVFIVFGESKFACDVSALNNQLRSYPTSNGVETYCLDMDTTWMVDKAKNLLNRLAYSLRSHEIALGVEEPTTVVMRTFFKDAHATFINFGLCDANQGVYLREAEKDKEPEAEIATASPA